MAQLIRFLKDKKVRNSLLFLFFVVFPISAAYAAWLTDSWVFSDMEDEDGPATPEQREIMEHIEYNLKNVRCPARKGRKLLDYWECLWRTSITTEGMEQHRRILAENLAYSYDTSGSQRNNVRRPSTRKKREVSKKPKKKIVKRQIDENPTHWESIKMLAHLSDSILLVLGEGPFRRQFLNYCQHFTLEPGSSIFAFWKCFRDVLSSVLSMMPPLSLNATFQPSTFPPVKNGYDSNQFKLLQLQNIYNISANYLLQLEFERLRDEDRVSSFKGADPYLEEAWSEFRYRFTNLDGTQHAPAWSYKSLYSPNIWHQLDNRKFYVPLRNSERLNGIEFLSDLAQAFPGIGEIASLSKYLQAPLDPRWTKDSGYSAYTRFPLPVFTKSDLAYYKSKHLIDSSVKMKSDAAVIQDIIDDLKTFRNVSSERLAFLNEVTQEYIANPKFTTDEQIPYVQAYQQFLNHFFKVDIGKYKAYQSREKNRTVLLEEYEIVRSLLHVYTEGVLVQEACTREMVDQYEFRRDGKELEELIEKAINSDPNNPNGACITTPDFNTSEFYNQSNFVQTKLKDLYNSYFDRKDARQRYSLPRYPLEYKICSETDQSPIDISTNRGRQSSLKDYIFGDAAYRLARFFMFFPIDSSTLLTVGVVNGERQDDSAVRLSGGAVKGQPLSFQYMHIRFANNWKANGSEHTIDGKGAVMELQMVFTIAGSADQIKYWHVLARVQNQLFQFRGKLVIIISVLVDVIGTDEQLKEKIAQDELNQDPYLFEPLAQAAYQFRVNYPNTTERPRGYVSKDPAFRLIDFIPRKSSRFYTYRGSLSWPPCFGYVIWSVYEQRLYMSRRQFDQFVKIPAYGINDNNLANQNFRKQDDIYVAREQDTTQDYQTIQALKRQRTIDRHILVGYHDIIAETETKETLGLVGEEIYYSNEDSSAATHDGQLFLIILSFTVYFRSCSN